MAFRCSCTMGDLTNFGHKIQSLSILWPAFVKPLTMSNDCPSHVHIFVHKYNLCPKIVRIWDKDYPTKKFGQSLYVCIQSLSRMCPHTWEVWLNWHLRCTFCPDLVHVQSMSRLNPCPEIVNFFSDFVQGLDMYKICPNCVLLPWCPFIWLNT